jgi:hypothetical protein
MGAVVLARRRAASHALIAKLVELAYLLPAKRYKEGVVEHAVARLRQALERVGVICDGDLSRHQHPAARKMFGADEGIDAAPNAQARFHFWIRAALRNRKYFTTNLPSRPCSVPPQIRQVISRSTVS